MSCAPRFKGRSERTSMSCAPPLRRYAHCIGLPSGVQVCSATKPSFEYQETESATSATWAMGVKPANGFTAVVDAVLLLMQSPLYPPPLRRTAAVVRNRRHVANHHDVQPGGG